MQFQIATYVLGALAALVIGLSKTGVPGVGILCVPLMATAFGGSLSLGATLPMLVFADIFAVAFYRSHAQWDKLLVLIPWVLLGLGAGTAFLYFIEPGHTLNVVIGVMVLAMLGVSLMRTRLGDRLVPTSPIGTVFTGALGGFSTMVSNAAGPIMSIYMSATGMPKDQLMGTSAWYFFIFNLVKVPLIIGLTHFKQQQPFYNNDTLLFDLTMFPLVLIGALAGRKLLPVIPQKAFTTVILALAALGAIKLILPDFHLP